MRFNTFLFLSLFAVFVSGLAIPANLKERDFTDLKLEKRDLFDQDLELDARDWYDEDLEVDSRAPSIFSAVKGAVSAVKGIAGVAGKFTKAASAVASKVGSVARKAGSAAKAASSKAGSMAKKAGGAAKKVAGKAGATAQKAGSKTKAVAKNASQKTKSAAKSGANKARGAAKKAGGAVKGAGSKVKTATKTAGSKAKTAARNAGTKAKGSATKAKNAVKGAAKDPKGTVKNAAKNAKKSAKNAVADAKTSLRTPIIKNKYHVAAGGGKPAQTYSRKDVKQALKDLNNPNTSNGAKRRAGLRNFNNRPHVRPNPGSGSRPLPSMRGTGKEYPLHTAAQRTAQPNPELRDKGPARIITQQNSKGKHKFRGVVAHDQSRPIPASAADAIADPARYAGHGDHFKVPGRFFRRFLEEYV